MTAPLTARFLALTIDMVVSVILGSAVQSGLIILFFAVGSGEMREAVERLATMNPESISASMIPWQMQMIVCIGSVVPALYFLTEAVAGVTFGKRLFAIRICGAEGRSLTLGQGTLRWAIKCLPLMMGALMLGTHSMVVQALSIPISAVVVVGGVLVFLPGGRALHDRLSRTAVFWAAAHDIGGVRGIVLANAKYAFRSSRV